VTEPVEGEIVWTDEVTESEEMPELVRQLLTDAMLAARPGQTVRFTADDRDTGRRMTWSGMRPDLVIVDEPYRRICEGCQAGVVAEDGEVCSQCEAEAHQHAWSEEDWEARRRQRAVERIRKELGA
jgi:hypothetical protein